MMYIEHTNLEDNLHHILTNREPTSSSPSASEATAAASALLARVREAHDIASSSLQQQTTSTANNFFQNKWARRPEPNLLPLNNFNSLDISKGLDRVLTAVGNTAAAPSKQVQENHYLKKEEEEEQYELLRVIDSDRTAQPENSKTFRVVNNEHEESENCAAATNHFIINTDGQTSSSSAAAPVKQVQVDEDEDEDFEYVVTRVPKRILQEPVTNREFDSYSILNRKVRRPVPKAIPIDSQQTLKSYNNNQLPPVTLQIKRPVPELKKFPFDSQVHHTTHRELNGYASLYDEDENNCDYYSDSETVEAASTRKTYARSNDFFRRQEDQMGLDIINKLKQLFNWNSQSHCSTDFQESNRKRRFNDWSACDSTGPQQIKYRKVENRFPKYISVRAEEDDVNEFLPPFTPHNQQQKYQKYNQQYLLNNSEQNYKTLSEMSNRSSTSLDKPPLRKSIFSAPRISQQIIKNTNYADVEFYDDDEPCLIKGFNPTALSSAKRVPHVVNIPIIRTDQRVKPTQQKPLPPPLIEPSTGSILQSSLIPRIETKRNQTYAETLRQGVEAGQVLGGRNSHSPSGASTSESSRILNGLNNLRTSHWSTRNRSSILNSQKESDERDKYQQLLEQVVPRLYHATGDENKLSSASSSIAAQRRRSALLLAGGIPSSACSSPAIKKSSMGPVPSFLKRPPLSSTINLYGDEDDNDDDTITNISRLKAQRSTKTKQPLPPTVIVDDDEISDIIDLGNEDRHVLSACAKIQKEKNSIVDLCEEKVQKPMKDALPFVEPVNSLKDRFNTSPHVKDNWLQNFQSKWLQRKKNRHDEVQETVKVTEKLTAERRAAEAEIQERLRKFQIVDPELIVVDDFEDAVEEPEFVELTQEHRARIHAAMYGPIDQILITKFNLNISRRDLHTLCGNNWLNDEVINFYMNLITERGEKKHDSHGFPKVYAMNTFFVPRLIQAGHSGVKRWTRKVDIFSKDIVPVPVHVGGVHWCMAIIHLKNRSIKYYDSMGTPNPTVLKALEQYLKDESMDKRKQTFDTTGFTIESVQGVPRQMNGSDCGVFSCMFAEYITRNREITFSQQNMEHFRQKMVLEIVMGDLLQ